MVVVGTLLFYLYGEALRIFKKKKNKQNPNLKNFRYAWGCSSVGTVFAQPSANSRSLASRKLGVVVHTVITVLRRRQDEQTFKRPSNKIPKVISTLT